MAADKLLFVISTPTSTQESRRRLAERSQIQSHVQRRRRRAEQRRDAQGRDAQPWSQLSSTILIDRKENGSKEGDQESPGSSTLTLVESWDPGRSRHLTHNTTDPFDCTIAAADAEAHVLLRSTLYIASRGNFLAEAYAPASVIATYPFIRHARIFQERLRRCVSDETLMYATLAYSASLWAWTTGTEVKGSRSPEYLLQKALDSMKGRLLLPRAGQQTDVWLLLSVHSLAVTEMWNGTPELWKHWPERYARASEMKVSAQASSRVHLTALIRLVAEAGGWHNFDPYILESSLLADKYSCNLHMNEPPLIRLDNVSRPKEVMDLLLEKYALVILPRLGSKLCGISGNSDLSGSIVRLVDYVRIAHCLWQTPERLSYPVESWLFLELQALTGQIFRTFYSSSRPLDLLMCLSMLSFLYGTMSHPGPTISSRKIAHHARDLLLLHGSSLMAATEKGLRLWILCIHALISCACEQREWFEREAEKYLPADMDEGALIDVLEDYLFFPDRHVDRVFSMFTNLRSRKRSRKVKSV